MYKIMVEVEVMRRKKIIVVVDESDQVAWTGTNMCRALEYLESINETQAELVDETQSWGLSFEPMPW
jgi:hypothetical protein